MSRRKEASVVGVCNPPLYPDTLKLLEAGGLGPQDLWLKALETKGLRLTTRSTAAMIAACEQAVTLAEDCICIGKCVGSAALRAVGLVFHAVTTPLSIIGTFVKPENVKDMIVYKEAVRTLCANELSSKTSEA